MKPILIRIKQGVFVGWGFAAVYSLLAVIIYIIGGPKVLKGYNTTLWALIFMYFVSGTLGGAIVGALKPLTKTPVGAVTVYAIASFFIFVCLGTLVTGPFSNWEIRILWFLIPASIFFGFVGARLEKKLAAMDDDVFLG